LVLDAVAAAARAPATRGAARSELEALLQRLAVALIGCHDAAPPAAAAARRADCEHALALLEARGPGAALQFCDAVGFDAGVVATALRQPPPQRRALLIARLHAGGAAFARVAYAEAAAAGRALELLAIEDASLPDLAAWLAPLAAATPQLAWLLHARSGRAGEAARALMRLADAAAASLAARRALLARARLAALSDPSQAPPPALAPALYVAEAQCVLREARARVGGGGGGGGGDEAAMAGDDVAVALAALPEAATRGGAPLAISPLAPLPPPPPPPPAAHWHMALALEVAEAAAVLRGGGDENDAQLRETAARVLAAAAALDAEVLQRAARQAASEVGEGALAAARRTRFAAALAAARAHCFFGHRRLYAEALKDAAQAAGRDQRTLRIVEQLRTVEWDE
jgi:hypothetical protein